MTTYIDNTEDKEDLTTRIFESFSRCLIVPPHHPLSFTRKTLETIQP